MTNFRLLTARIEVTNASSSGTRLFNYYKTYFSALFAYEIGTPELKLRSKVITELLIMAITPSLPG